MTLWSHDLARSRGKLKILHIGYKNTCDNQTWQDDLPWVGPTHKVTCPFSHVVFWDHVTKKLVLSPLPQCLWPPNLAGWWHTFEGLLPIKSNDPLIAWFCRITWQTKTYISLLPQYPWLPKLIGWWLTIRGFNP